MTNIGRGFFLSLGLFPIISYFASTFLAINFLIAVRVYTILFFLFFVFNYNISLRFPRYLNYLVLYIVYLLAWDVYNYYYDLSPHIEAIRKPHVETVLALLLIENISFDNKNLKKIFAIIKVTIIIAFIVTVVQIFVNPSFFVPPKLDYLIQDYDIYTTRRPSIFGYYGPNMIGLAFLPLASLYFGKLAYANKVNVFVSLVFVLMVGIISFATNARYVMASFFIILMQFPLAKSGNIVNRIFLMTITFGLALFAFYFIFTSVFNYDVNSFIERRLFPEQDITRSSRFFAFNIFSEFFPENWLLGTGVHLTPEIERAIGGFSSQIHVGYLSHLVSYGIIGSFFLFMFWLTILKKFYTTAKNSKFYGALFGFLVFLFANLTLVHYPIFNYGLIFCFIANKYFELNNYRPSLQPNPGNA